MQLTCKNQDLQQVDMSPVWLLQAPTLALPPGLHVYRHSFLIRGSPADWAASPLMQVLRD